MPDHISSGKCHAREHKIEMALFGDGYKSADDILLTVFILTLMAIGVPSNIVVIRDNLRKRTHNICRTLLLMLSISDLITCLYLPPMASYQLLIPKDTRCWDNTTSTLTASQCDTLYYAYSRPHPTILERALSVLCKTLGYIPSLVTALLALIRFLKIKLPMKIIPQGPVVAAVVVPSLLLLTTIIDLMWPKGDDTQVVFYASSTVVWGNVDPNVDIFIFGIIMPSFFAFYLFVFVFVILYQIIGVVASLGTIWELLKMYKNPVSDSAKARGMEGSIRILITNFGSLMLVSLMLAKGYITGTLPGRMKSGMEVGEAFPKSFAFIILCYAVLGPLLFSTINPLLYLAFTKNWNKARSTLKSLTESIGLSGLKQSKITQNATSPMIAISGNTVSPLSDKSVNENNVNNQSELVIQVIDWISANQGPVFPDLVGS
eukprot:sb/3464882/